MAYIANKANWSRAAPRRDVAGANGGAGIQDNRQAARTADQGSDHAPWRGFTLFRIFTIGRKSR